MNSVCPDELKLVALDKDDIEVVSAHVQDAMVRIGDIFWQPREHRFVMAVNRFDWMTAVDANTRKIVRDVLRSLAQAGKTIIAATHDTHEIEFEFDKVIHLTAGAADDSSSDHQAIPAISERV